MQVLQKLDFPSTYQRIISILTIVLLCWNFAGTLVSGLVMNHLHTQGEGSYCEVSFCSCSVEDGQKICTCHHPELQHMNHDGDMASNHHHSSEHNEAGFCYFSADHSQAQSIPTVIVEFSKLNAVHGSGHSFNYFHRTNPFSIHPNPVLLNGISDELLKPPRA